MHNVGISGCKLKICNDKIKKISSNTDYNDRLFKQIEKQYNFNKINKIPNIKTPFVTKIKKGRLVEFEMEYINGQSFFDFFSNCSVVDVENTSNCLVSYLNWVKINYPTYYDQSTAKALISSKLNSLMAGSKYKKFISFLIKTNNNNLLKIPLSISHGDLTFSNIIFKKNILYFIDFLDSFIESYLIDIIKLRQDTLYHWSLNYNNTDNNPRLIEIFNKIDNLIVKNFKQETDSIEYKILEAINLLRIEKYLPISKTQILNNMLKQNSLYENFIAATSR